MAINLTDSLNAATTKGKLGDAKQVYLNGDTKNLQKAYEETNTHFGTLDNRSTQMEKAIQDISATGGASTANAVSYNNSTSKLEAITAQGAIDEVSSIGYFAKRGGIVNISTNYNSINTAEVLTLAQAIAKVPSKDRVLGFIGRFYSSDGWKTYSFNGESLAEWGNTSKWGLVSDSSNIKNGLGGSIENPITQEAASEASLYSMPFTGGWDKESGTEFEGLIYHCLTALDEPKNRYIDSGEDSIYKSFTTYYHTNNNNYETIEEYIYADFNIIGNHQYRSVAIFDSNDNLVYQGRHFGKCLFKLPPKYTIYISASRFTTVPVYGISTIDRDEYIKKISAGGLVSNSIIKPSENKALSLASSSYLDKSFISTAFIPPLGVDNIGEPVGTLLDNCVIPEFTELESIKSSEVENGYKTYIYTNDSQSIQYIYAEFYNAAQYSNTYGKYMKCGLYNKDKALIRSSIQDGKLLFAVLPGYTLVISGNKFVQIPVNVSRSIINYSTYDYYTDKYVSSYAQYTRVLKFAYAESSDIKRHVEYKQNVFTATLSWGKNVECSYSYLSSLGKVQYRNNAEYKFIIRNTGNSSATISVGATRGSADWSKGFFVEKRNIVIRPGESSVIILTKEDKFDSPPEENADIHLLVVLKGALGADVFSGGSGSLEVECMWQENAANAMNAINAVNAMNAGWLVGGLSNNAVLRDVPASGGVSGAMTLERIDNRTVHISTKIDSTIIGSIYRGIYWKIEYSNFENDIKGIWRLTNTYSKYQAHIVSGIKDWGPTETDVLSINSPENGSAEWNLYELIMDYKAQQEKAGSDSKWTGALVTNGYFYIALINYKHDGLIEAFDDTLTLDRIPLDYRVIATELSPKLDQEIKDAIENQSAQKIQVTNWGDSLTAGAGQNAHTNQQTVINSIKAKGYPDLSLTEQSNITYSIMMQELLGDRYNVTNCGVGGENINTIAARLGANLVYSINDFVLPADTTPVQIGTYNDKLKSSWDTTVAPLLQGHGNSVNPCYVQGIECILKWTGSSYNDINGTYTLQRTVQADRSISLPQKTPIILSGSKLYRNTKLAVLWCWQNAGYTNDTELIEKLDKMIAHLNTSNYVIVGLHSGTKSSRQGQEDMLTSKYGDKFFNWRQYASTNALYDFGISPSESDLTAMESGSTPPSLLVDNVHLCAAGYAILGFKIIERFKNLGYIS